MSPSSSSHPQIDERYTPEEISTAFDDVICNGLVGRVLTILDAALPDGKQTQAIKDLIKAEIRDHRNPICDLFWDFCIHHKITSSQN